MIDLLENNPIQRAFSKAAVQYDVLTSLHKEIGRELIQKIKDIKDPSLILDIGMGAGWLTNRLTFYFPDAMVVGLDFSSGMVRQAQKRYEHLSILQANAHPLPFKKGRFDLLLSNLAYQWVKDLSPAFQSASHSLKEGGVVSLTMFGYQTLKELFQSLEDTRGNNEKILIHRLASQDQVRAAMEQAGFHDIRIHEEYITVHFPDMMALLRWIKDIGANALSPDVFFGRQWLLRAKDYYHKNFKDRFGVSATFEVLWVEGKKYST